MVATRDPTSAEGEFRTTLAVRSVYRTMLDEPEVGVGPVDREH